MAFVTEKHLDDCKDTYALSPSIKKNLHSKIILLFKLRRVLTNSKGSLKKSLILGEVSY